MRLMAASLIIAADRWGWVGTGPGLPACGPGAGSLRASITGRSGSSRWTCSTNRPRSDCGPQCCSRTPVRSERRLPPRPGRPGPGIRTASQCRGGRPRRVGRAAPAHLRRAGTAPTDRYRTRPVSLRKHVLAQGRDSAFAVTWRNGSKAAMSARFAFLQARLAGRRPKPAPDGAFPLRWLIAAARRTGRAGQVLDLQPFLRQSPPRTSSASPNCAGASNTTAAS